MKVFIGDLRDPSHQVDRAKGHGRPKVGHVGLHAKQDGRLASHVGSRCHLIFMKRKPLNKSRFTYLKQNTPLNVVPEKKLKKADLAGLIENRGKSRFRTKRLRERIETLIRSDLMFKNKTNAKPHAQQLVRTTFIGNTFKARYPFHLNIHAKRSMHLLVHTTVKQTSLGSTSATSAKQQPSCVLRDGIRVNLLVHQVSKADQQKRTCFALAAKQDEEIGTKYIVKETFSGSTRMYSNTRFKVNFQDLKQLVEGRGRKVSPYKARLLERKKLSLIYGDLGWREIRKCVLQSKHKKGVASPKSGNKKTRPQTSSLPENLITLLESRLDVVLYRCRFFPSFSSCKQAINHGKILVNHRQVRITGHLLKAGDLIQVNPQSKQSLLVRKDFTADLALHQEPLRATSMHKQEITKAKGYSKSQQEESLLYPSTWCSNKFTQIPSRSTVIGSKTFVACPDSARLEQKHVVFKKANYLLALENEKQKTLLHFQNKIRSRPFSPVLPSTLLTRFDPLHHFPWNTNSKPNHSLHNNTSNQLVGTVVLPKKNTNKQDYGSCFLPHTLMVCKNSKPLSRSFKLTKTPRAKQLYLENQANSLFRNLKERKRILLHLSSRSNERLHGDGTHMMVRTDRLIKPLRNRDNPSLFLRPQSRSGIPPLKTWCEGSRSSNIELLAGIASQGRKEHNTPLRASLARATTGKRVFMPTASKSQHVLRAKQIPGLRELFPPFYRDVKPLNLEVSYQTLTAIFLFPPQKVYFPAHIDLEMIGKSI